MARQPHESDQPDREAGEVPTPPIGIDLDGTIDEAPLFFQILSRTYPGKVYILTYRDDLARAKKDVQRFGVRCDEVVLVNSFEQKAAEIRRLGIKVYFDDMDEMLMHVPEGVTVMKVRNGGNYDYEQKKWLYSAQTGYQI
jgi:hypothetical protein